MRPFARGLSFRVSLGMYAEECETRQITRERYHAQIYVVNADAPHDLLRLSGVDATLCAIPLIRSSPVEENGEALTWRPGQTEGEGPGSGQRARMASL